MKDYWIAYYQAKDEGWSLSSYLGHNERQIMDFWNDQPFCKTCKRVRIFRCQCDPNADILTVAQQLVWEKNGDVQRFINQETLNAS